MFAKKFKGIFCLPAVLTSVPGGFYVHSSFHRKNHLEVVQLDAFQLVLVGTVQETSCFLFEMPTGVVADLYK